MKRRSFLSKLGLTLGITTVPISLLATREKVHQIVSTTPNDLVIHDRNGYSSLTEFPLIDTSSGTQYELVIKGEDLIMAIQERNHKRIKF